MTGRPRVGRLAGLTGAPKRGKYNARKTVYDGQEYDSMGEAEHARHLDLRKAAGEIKDWRRGREWVLLQAPKKRDRITLRPDFEVWRPDESFYVLDFKGVLTPVFRLKAKLWRAAYPATPLYYVKADGQEVRM